MKKLLIAAGLCIPAVLYAQNAITSNLVEGGKTLVELIKVIRTPRIYPAADMSPAITNADSCVTKKLADIVFKNRTDKPIEVNLYLRIGNTYDTHALSLKLSALSQESLYELKSGVYKYKIEAESEDGKIILHEGELKLQPCDKLIKEIKG